MFPVREALGRGTGILRAAGIESARLDARVLLAFALGVSPDSIFALEGVSPEGMEEFGRVVERRRAREPLAYITGVREFWSLPFEVGPGVLIPRPETELLVEAALREFGAGDGQLRVLDIGTGSGCLLVAFLAERSRARGTAVDSSDVALAYARRNVIAHGLAARARLVQASWDSPGERAFDVVFCNPPYLSEAEFALASPEIRLHEPRSALVAGTDGLAAMRALAPSLVETLAPSGLAFVEIGAGQSAQVSEIILSCGLEVRQTIPDLSGVPRCLMIGRPGPGGA